MPWRPSRITNFTDPQAAHVVNQLFRETNGRIDDINQNATPTVRGQATLNYGSIAGNTCIDRPAHILGITANLVPHVSPVTTVGANLSWSSQVASSNVVNIRVCNHTTAPIAANTIQWRVVAQ